LRTDHPTQREGDRGRHEITDPRPVHRHAIGQPRLNRVERRPTDPVAHLLQPHHVVGVGQQQHRQCRPVAHRPHARQQAGERKRRQMGANARHHPCQSYARRG
jgi:hypothetical protein